MSLRNGSIQVEGMEYKVPKHLAVQIKGLVAPFAEDAVPRTATEAVKPAEFGIIIGELSKEGVETVRKELTKHLKTL